jgi:C1A family cysteine protease
VRGMVGFLCSDLLRRAIRRARSPPCRKHRESKLPISAHQPKTCDSVTDWGNAVAILKKGALSLAEYPYSESCAAPPANIIAKANDFRVLGFRVIDLKKAEDIKGQIARGNPVLLGFNAAGVFDNFRGDGIYTQPIRNPKAGGHAVVLIGYDDVRQAFRLLNSWGQNRADRGYAWISYETVTAQGTGAIRSTGNACHSGGLAAPTWMRAIGCASTPAAPFSADAY